MALILKVKDELLCWTKKRREQGTDRARHDTGEEHPKRQLCEVTMSYKASLSNRVLTVNDLQRAEQEIIHHCQKKNYRRSRCP